MAQSGSTDSEPLSIRYRFTLPNSEERVFDLRLNADTLELIRGPQAALPDWTRLTHQQCSNCPLKTESHPHCPAAVGLNDIVNGFRQIKSYEVTEVTIETAERTYSKKVSLQQGLSSLVGLVMVTSGCPIMAKLRPMVRFHLPFANLAETVYRVLSMYLLAQYLRVRAGKQPDWTLKGLVALYEEIHQVNRAFSQRLLPVVEADANLNALSILDIFGQTVNFVVDERMLDSLEQLFRPYIDEPDVPPRTT